MKVGKPQSKRVSVRLRHKIQKHSANKQRKDRKEAKKNPQWRSRLKKDPGVPNLFPYKDKILAEIEENKRKKEEEKERRRDIAKAQREGRAVDAAASSAANADVEVSDMEEEVDDDDDDDEMDEREEVNPLAALVASASQRARTYTKEDEDEEDDEDEDDDLAIPAKAGKAAPKSAEPLKKKLPKHVFDDPIKPVNRLLVRLQKTPDGLQQLLAYYQLPPLVTAGSDVTTRFLVDVARKRGRLSRGGVPNLQAAALTVLSDLQEQRLKLPALQQQKAAATTSKGEVQIVSHMAEPFRIEGLFGDLPASAGAMEIEA